MVFTSPIFLFVFLPLVLGGYFIVNPKYRNFFLMLASMFFYSWGGAQYLIIILFSTVVNYFIGIMVGEGERKSALRKTGLILGIVFNLSLLGYFKYYNFFLENLIHFGRVINLEMNITNTPIALPIGISFFTFQIMSYVIDVYKQEVKPQRSIINLSLYVMLFPQLIAGPIVRYIDVERQINERSITLEKFNQGVQRFMIGFSKKVLLSNATGYIADTIFNNETYYMSMPMTWVGIICYALQIYHDFSGYSDMAIGLGKIFGFDFLENFNYPYISKTIQEFWRRWHISLSTWFKDYVYIPLGGSRVGKWKTYRNLLIVFFVTGLWHGASWNFIVWGLWYGIFLILERGQFGKMLSKLPVFLTRCYALLIILVGWVFFRAENLTLALTYIKGMFSFNFKESQQLYLILDLEAIVFIGLAILFSMPVVDLLKKRMNQSFIINEGSKMQIAMKLSADIVLILVFILACLYMSGSSFNPFIYFRF